MHANAHAQVMQEREAETAAALDSSVRSDSEMPSAVADAPAGGLSGLQMRTPLPYLCVPRSVAVGVCAHVRERVGARVFAHTCLCVHAWVGGWMDRALNRSSS